jgi:uncharacterized protein YajQ (UPF0234 family)
MPSFDIVVKLEMHEVDNAVQQAKKEIAQRFDFKSANAEIDKSPEGITIKASSDNRVAAALEVLSEKLTKRKVSLKALDPQPAESAAGGSVRQLVKLKEGISPEKAKEIVKVIKDSKIKVQASIQGDTVRVTGKKRDDLQAVIQVLKGEDLDLPLQFTNFRE